MGRGIKRLDGRSGLPRRRGLLLAAPGLLLARQARAERAPLRFTIHREGRAIGTHRVSFEQAGASLTARTEVDIAVKVAGITMFRFTHRFTESWVADRLVAARSRRDRNGTVMEMSARAEGGALLVQGPEGQVRLPAEAAPLSWWDPSRLSRPLFANDTGKALALRLAHSARPGGGEIWRATGEGEESEGQYAADGSWLGWKTKAEDGSIVTYERA
jgi:hypothetical protein